MTRPEFYRAMKALIPNNNVLLTGIWAGFAKDISDHANEWLADCTEQIQRGELDNLVGWYEPRSVLENNLQEIHASLYNINRQYGADICLQIYELAKIPFCTYPLESPNVAEFLSKGGNPAEIVQRQDEGLFDWDFPEDHTLLTPIDSHPEPELAPGQTMQ